MRVEGEQQHGAYEVVVLCGDFAGGEPDGYEQCEGGDNLLVAKEMEHGFDDVNGFESVFVAS